MRVRKKRSSYNVSKLSSIDWEVESAPDLVIEIDITSYYSPVKGEIENIVKREISSNQVVPEQIPQLVCLTP